MLENLSESSSRIELSDSTKTWILTWAYIYALSTERVNISSGWTRETNACLHGTLTQCIIIGRILVDLSSVSQHTHSLGPSHLEQVWLSARTSIICTGSNKMYNKLKLWAPKHSSGTWQSPIHCCSSWTYTCRCNSLTTPLASTTGGIKSSSAWSLLVSHSCRYKHNRVKQDTMNLTLQSAEILVHMDAVSSSSITSS